jgi:hypothetical protein
VYSGVAVRVRSEEALLELEAVGVVHVASREGLDRKSGHGSGVQ